MFNICISNVFSSACSTASPSPRVLRPDYFFSMEVSPTSNIPFEYTGSNTADNKSPEPTAWNAHRPLQAMDTLKPPNFHLSPNSASSNLLSPSDSSSSPPRSNSVDLSILRKDIELWSVSSGDQSEIGSESEFEPTTPAESSIRTIRSRSHDPTQSPEHILRRPSRIEHLSEIFRWEANNVSKNNFFPGLTDFKIIVTDVYKLITIALK